MEKVLEFLMQVAMLLGYRSEAKITRAISDPGLSY